MSEQDTRNTREIINEIRAHFGAGPTTMTDEQIEAGREVYGAKLDYDMAVIDEVQDTREKLEAWAHEEIAEKWAQSDREVTMIMDDLHDLLDRQAAITSAEWCWSNDALEDELKRKEAEVAELIATCDALREQREHWFNEAVEIYRRFYPHDEYGIPQNIAEMVLAKVDELQAANKPNSQSDVLKTAETAENATSKDEIHDFDDSREQLEADVRTFFSACDDGLCFCANGEEYFIEILDRQAAITERELCSRCSPYATAKDYLDTIDELTAERDNLQAAIDAMNNGQFYAMYKAKCEECEQLKKVARTQAESFKKLECELAGKDG